MTGRRGPSRAQDALTALLTRDSAFARQVPAGEREQVARTLSSASVSFGTGTFAVEELELPEATWGLLLCEGAVLKTVEYECRSLTELLVAGDVLLPWSPAVDGLAADLRLEALEPVRLVALEERFVRVAARWPSLMVELQRRLAQQEHRVAVHGAICQLPRVEDRIVAVLRHFASRIGRVRPDGTRVPLDLTHEALGSLVGARRPTVSLALTRLADFVHRLEDGTWLLDAAVPNDPSVSFTATQHLEPRRGGFQRTAA